MCALEDARHREDVADVVIDDQHLLAREHRVRFVELAEQVLLRHRQP